MTSSLALDDFLGHETRSGGGGGTQYLRGWRKLSPPQVETVLHRRASIYALWQHQLPRIFEKKSEDGDVTRVVYGSSWNCLEHEDVLKRQYKRDRDTDERLTPPVLCPVCRLQEHLRSLYNKGDISFTEKLFSWEGDDGKPNVLTYGGMLNLYGSDYLTDEEEEAKKRARIRESEAWKENVYAKCNYAFVVVDNANPDAGVQIAVETTALGDAVKECIRNQITSLGDDGNPIKNPYVIRWEHHPNAKEFNKKYKAIAMPRIEITDRVLTLIDSEPPDLSATIRPGNVKSLRADLEAACLVSCIDWDWVFGPAEKAQARDEDEEAEETKQSTSPQRRQEPAPTPRTTVPNRASEATTAQQSPPPQATGGRRRKAEPEPEPEPEPEIAPDAKRIKCDECGYMMLETDTKCDRCGAEYEITDEQAPPPPPPKKEEPKKGRGKVPF